MSAPDELRRLTAIAKEVMDLIGEDTISGFLDSEVGNFSAVESRLQEVMMERQRFEVIELSMYLRTSFSRQQHLPTWQPLLNAAVELARQRGEAVDDMFFGLLPPAGVPDRNTSGMVGPRHPQMQKR
jgi:hypothetical protein